MTEKSRLIFLPLLFVLLVGLLGSCSEKKEAEQPASELISRDILFGNPEKTSPRLSPDGTRMSYLAPVDGVLNVWVGGLGSAEVVPVTKDTLRGIRMYAWAEDNRHILYLQDKGGDENWRIYAVNLESGDTRDLTPFEGVQARIAAMDKEFPNEILVSLNKESQQLHDIYHLDLTSGELTRVTENPGNVIGWVPDANFEVRAATAANELAGYDLLYRETSESEWETIASWSSENALNSAPLTFSKDGKSLYMIDSRDVNAARLVAMNLASREIEVIAEDPMYDVTNVMFDPDTYDVQAVYFEKERQEVVVLDEDVREDLETIAAIHHGDYSIVSRDNADDTWLIGFSADDGPVSYYSYDVPTNASEFLFFHKPMLAEYNLASMEPVQFTARDGLVVHGYITFPPGVERENLPMVLNVHGGPWYRDSWGYNPEAQWFANRGYICLQVNFRGSRGYGKDFLNAGDREWGGKMHDDLIDAVDWAVEMGYADPEKVAIYGGSYGGYAALVGATFTPDVFCCAVDMVGPSNLITFLNSIPPYWETMREMLHRRVGNPETEEEFLRSRSPLFKVDQIKIPMLIAQGANDPRVKQAEAEQIVDALKKNSVDYEYLLFEDEGHGFARPENRLKFYAAAEEFLAKHLGGRYEPAGDDSMD